MPLRAPTSSRTTPSPRCGPVGELGQPGDGIWIYGSGFTGATGVSFGGNGASYWQVDGDSEIYATVPSGSSGQQVDVTVSGPGGTSCHYERRPVHLLPPAQVTGLSESSGNCRRWHLGSTAPASPAPRGVDFGGNGASLLAGLRRQRDRRHRAVGLAGQQVDVTVTGPGGTSSTGWADQFTYNYPQPQVRGLSETYGNAGDTIYIYGSGFTGASGLYSATGTQLLAGRKRQ